MPVSGVGGSGVLFPRTLNPDTRWSVMSPSPYGRFNPGGKVPVSILYVTGSTLIWDLNFVQERTFFSWSQNHLFCCTLSTPVAVAYDQIEVGPLKHMSLINCQLNPMKQSPWQVNSQLIKTFHTIYGTRAFSTISEAPATAAHPETNESGPNRRKLSDPPSFQIAKHNSACSWELLYLLLYICPANIVHLVSCNVTLCLVKCANYEACHGAVSSSVLLHRSSIWTLISWQRFYIFSLRTSRHQRWYLK